MKFKIQNSKFKIQNFPKGNISLIMIFVLAIGAIMGLMSTNFLQNMIRETSALKTSYQSYYLAKGGIELGNLAVNKYDYGFEDELQSGSTIFTNNFLCGNKCPVHVTITSLISSGRVGNLSTPITNCTPANAIWLSSGSSQIIPLFIDTRTIADNTKTTKNIISDYDLSLVTANNSSGDIGVGLILSTANQLTYDMQDINDMQKLYVTGNAAGFNIKKDLLQYTMNISNSGEVKSSINTILANGDPYNYLAITNIGTDGLGICLNFSVNGQGGYPLDTSKVISNASYRDSSLSLQSIIKKILPDYVYNSYQGN